MKKLCLIVSLIAGFALSSAAFASDSSAVDSGEQPTSELVNINTASQQDLVKLKGIGPKKAEAIIAWRDANGEFKNIEQLLDVKGIGHAILEDNRQSLTH